MLDGVIYKIEICNEIYIGSTIEKINIRQKNHNHDLKRKNQKLQIFCRENNINKITLIELEKIKVNNKKELKIIEQEYINKLKPTLNTHRAYRTEEEIKNRGKIYKQNNKEKIQEYYENNKEKRNEYFKKYRDNNKEKKVKNIMKIIN